MFWVYKCNSREHDYQWMFGDWKDFFLTNRAVAWGSTEFIRALAQAKPGDTILAYQTDRNELVGLARVSGWRLRGKFQDLILKPVRRIGVKVRALKVVDPKLANIPALFQVGPIKTLYPIDVVDVRRVFRAAGVHLRLQRDRVRAEVASALKGAGFGNSTDNRKVEVAAMRHTIRDFKRNGWEVEDVSSRKLGYDLLCKRKGISRHVEVKGVTGQKWQFIITAREKRAMATDRNFLLVLVTNAMSREPDSRPFSGAEALRRFIFRPISFIAC